MNMVDNEVTINNWRPDLVIQEFLYSRDFLLVSLPGLSSGDNTQGYSQVECKPKLFSRDSMSLLCNSDWEDDVEARAEIISPHSCCEFIALLHSALIASVLNLIPVDIHTKSILTGVYFCTDLYEK